MDKLYKENLLSELFDAWYRFKRGKSKKQDVMLFENNLESNIFSIYDDIRICVQNVNDLDIEKIIKYLNLSLKLEVPIEKIQLIKNLKGVNFLGVKVFKNHISLSKKSSMKILKRAKESNLSSYLGFIKKYNCYQYRLRLKAKCIRI